MPVTPKPVSKDDDGWDLQQRNVEEQIEAALFRPTLGEGATHVESFRDDADIKAHMVPPSHGYYGLDTHTYKFSVAAQRQFWRWHFENEERIRQERLAEHDRKTAEFNRKIQERKRAIHAARPRIEVISEPRMRRRDFGVKVRCTVGAGPGPIEYYYVAFRPVEMRGQPDHTWTKWRTDFRAHNMPKEVLVYTLDPNREYDIAVYGGSRRGGVYSDPVTVGFKEVQPPPPAPAPEPEPPTAEEVAQEQAQEQAEPPAAPEPEPEDGPKPVHSCSFSGVWGNAWGRFPGMAPARSYGSISNADLVLPNGTPSKVTAVFRTNPRTLRLTLAPGTPADEFPDEIRVSGGLVFDDPAGMQTFGLGNARDYELEEGSPDDIRVGGTSMIVMEWYDE